MACWIGIKAVEAAKFIHDEGNDRGPMLEKSFFYAALAFALIIGIVAQV